MDQILAGIGDTIGDIIDSPVVQIGARLIFLYIVILWIATAYWAFRDMQQRSDNAILPYLVAAGIILFTPFFFIFAVWVYKIVRPHEKIGEVWERNLAEEALLAEVEAIRHCPTCERRIDDEWIICPSCRTRLNRVCPNCSAWSASTGRCARGAARTSSGVRSRPPPPSKPLPSGRRRHGSDRRAGAAACDAGIPAAIQTTVRSAAARARGAGRSRRPPGSAARALTPVRRRPAAIAGRRLPAEPAAPVARSPRLRGARRPADARRPGAGRPSRSRAVRRPACSSSAGSRPSSASVASWSSLLAGGRPLPRSCWSSGCVAVDRADRRRRRAGHRAARTRRHCRYAGPSPFLVFAASIPVSLLAVLVFAIPLAIAGVALDGPVGQLLSVVDPGAGLHRPDPPARRRHRSAVTGPTWVSAARSTARSASWPAGRCGRCRSSSSRSRVWRPATSCSRSRR